MGIISEWIRSIFLKMISVIKLFLLLAALGLHGCVQAFSSCSDLRLLSSRGVWLLTAVASLLAEHRLQVLGLQ